MSSISRWVVADSQHTRGNRIDWLRVAPFIAVHLGALAAPLVGVRWIDVAAAVALYVVRMFAITAFYHRYFAHRAFRASRGWQFVFALLGASAAQRGPLWWASMHRTHHAAADTAADPHSPQHGFWRSHLAWFLTDTHFATDSARVRDWSRFPELRFLDRFDALVPALLAAALFAAGTQLEGFGTSGIQFMLWGFCVSTVVLLHVTLMVNSVAHRFGKRRFETRDQSRNLPWLAWLTFGEGWHNNHHRYAGSARQGFYRGEFDLSYLLLRALAAVGVVSDLRPVPVKVLEEGRR